MREPSGGGGRQYAQWESIGAVRPQNAELIDRVRRAANGGSMGDAFPTQHGAQQAAFDDGGP